MNRYPVLAPTTYGPMGGIVHDPGGDIAAAAVILQGVANGRFGQNRLWAHLGDALAGLGLAVLRLDYAGRGDSVLTPRPPRAGHFKPVHEAVQWFLQTVGNPDLYIAARCYGARAAFGLIEQVPRTSGLMLILPNFRLPPARLLPTRSQRVRARVARGKLVLSARHGGGRRRILFDPAMTNALELALRRVPVWTLHGDRDYGAIFRVQAGLSEEARRNLTVEVVEDVKLQNFRTPETQAICIERVAAWAAARVRDGAPA